MGTVGRGEFDGWGGTGSNRRPPDLDGKIIGAIGVSGGSSAQDGQVAGGGAAVIK
jgi:Haem-degrading